jgi:DNA replication protein DnaC
MGLGLVGSVGSGKTRAAYFLLERMLEEDHTVWATNATAFARFCIDQFSENRDRRPAALRSLESIYHTDIWLLDDLGKQRMTERGEVELYTALEYRTSRKRPTIWTSDLKGDSLAARFSQERGEAIMRRLINFSDIIEVWESTTQIQRH